MSTGDLRESSTRVDRSTPQDGVTLDPRFLAARRTWVAGLLLLPLMLALPAWLAEDQAGVVSQLRGGESVVEAPAIPLHVNESVEHWIEQFQTTRRAEFEALLRRRGLFEGMIRSKLRERDMPEDLMYLAMIESGLSPVAESHVSAVGLWQFMGPTALDLGLRVDDSCARDGCRARLPRVPARTLRVLVSGSRCLQRRTEPRGADPEASRGRSDR